MEMTLLSRSSMVRDGSRESTIDGIEVSVWDARSCAPLDPAMIADAAAHPVVVTVEDGIFTVLAPGYVYFNNTLLPGQSLGGDTDTKEISITNAIVVHVVE